jgi:hypothetical protein
MNESIVLRVVADFQCCGEPLDLPGGVGVWLIRNGSFVHGFGAAL